MTASIGAAPHADATSDEYRVAILADPIAPLLFVSEQRDGEITHLLSLSVQDAESLVDALRTAMEAATTKSPLTS